MKKTLMTLPEKKEYLNQALCMDKSIQGKKDVLHKLHTMLDNLEWLEQRSTSVDSLELSHLRQEIRDIEDQYVQGVTRLLYIKTKIIEAIENMKDLNEKALLEKRYVACMHWKDIAESMYYGEQWIHKLHIKALQKLTLEK